MELPLPQWLANHALVRLNETVRIVEIVTNAPSPNLCRVIYPTKCIVVTATRFIICLFPNSKCYCEGYRMNITSRFIKYACVQILLAWLTLPPLATASGLMELPPDAIQKLKIDAGFGWGIFSGTIFNGNDNYHITQLVVSMTPVHDHHHMHMHPDMPHDPRTHRIDLDLPPASKGALSMALPADVADVHDFKWEIIKVTGYQTR